ncbi:hypothetical protein KQX54_016970, partial [Cotesia glomerata]
GPDKKNVKPFRGSYCITVSLCKIDISAKCEDGSGKERTARGSGQRIVRNCVRYASGQRDH